MYPNPFEYERADDVQDALSLLEEHAGREIEIISGGHSLVPTMKSGLADPDILIDIGEIDNIDGIEVGAKTTRFGALTNYADIAQHEGARDTCPTLTEAAGEIGDVQVRNRGTIGGNLAHSDPASDLPAAALAADATIHARGPDGAREISADDFFFGMYATDLTPDELLTGVEVPNAADNEVGAYVKKANPASGYALIGVAVRLLIEDGVVEAARVAANGAIDHGVRLDPVEEALIGESASEDLAETAAEFAGDNIEDFLFMEDLQASGEFRAHLLEVYTQRALTTAFDRAE
jgi:carbon-monoxide dehydrogenase medium subunit